jgi:hypothetical protein
MRAKIFFSATNKKIKEYEMLNPYPYSDPQKAYGDTFYICDGVVFCYHPGDRKGTMIPREVLPSV